MVRAFLMWTVPNRNIKNIYEIAIVFELYAQVRSKIYLNKRVLKKFEGEL